MLAKRKAFHEQDSSVDVQNIKGLKSMPAPVRATSCDLFSLSLPTSQFCSTRAAWMLSALTSEQ